VNKEAMMALLIGDTAPDFEAETTEGKIRFYDFIDGQWAVIFSHPADFTPVCTTELGYSAKLKPEFDKRNVKVIGLSVDPIEDHRAWLGDIEETQGTAVNFPMIADADGSIATAYGMIHPNSDAKLTVRSLFVIGPDKKIKLKIEYPPSTGRNFNEVLRVIDSLQASAKHSVATPANWEPGDDVIVSLSVSDEDARKRFGSFNAPKPYLRIIPQPKG
jgi:alkyl hydroperoxide reductase subunit AhpC